MANFYNRATGQFFHSQDGAVFCNPRTPQMRQKRDAEGNDLLDAQGNPTGEQELESAQEASGPVQMKTGTAQVGNININIADLMRAPDLSEVWSTSRDNANKGVPLPYWKPHPDGSNKIVEITDAEKAVVDTARDIKQGKTEFNGEHYAFVDERRTDLIAAHSIRNETGTTFPMTIKSSDMVKGTVTPKTISIPDVATIETLFNAVFGL